MEQLAPPLLYPASVVLYRQGDQAQEVFHLEHGLVKLLRLDQAGEEVIIGLRSAGWFLGAAAVILSEPHAVTAVTVAPCRLARVSADRFRQIVRSNGALSWRLHRMHSQEVYGQHAQVADLTRVSARERLEQLLRRLAPRVAGNDHEGNELRVEAPLRHWEIAQLLGVTAPYLCQLLKELEHQGTLRREGQTLVLQNRPR